MSFPDVSVVPPTFSIYPSAYFQGITWSGFGGPFYIQGSANFDGIWMPNVRSGDTSAPRTAGSYTGLDVLDVRDVTMTFDIGPPFGDYENMPGAQAALRQAFTPTGWTENPFFFQISEDSPMFVMMVRPRKRDGQLDQAYVLGNLAQKVPSQFHATDPTLYSAGTQEVTLDPPSPLKGFSFPIFGGTNLSFGGGASYTSATVTNIGDLPCYPILTFVGPCTVPSLTNSSLTNEPYLQYGLTMAAGDQLVVNLDPKYPSAMYYPNGSPNGYDVSYAETQGSSWWALATGDNVLLYTTQDTEPVDAYVTVEYASAFSAAS